MFYRQVITEVIENAEKKKPKTFISFNVSLACPENLERGTPK